MVYGRLMWLFYIRHHMIVSRHRQLMNIGLKKPVFEDNVFIAPNASVIGSVQLGANTSVGYGAVLRADAVPIVVSSGSHIGDNVVIHCTRTPEERGNPTFIGRHVVLGPRSTIYSCTIYDHVYIGWGAVVEDDCILSPRCVVAAGKKKPLAMYISIYIYIYIYVCVCM